MDGVAKSEFADASQSDGYSSRAIRTATKRVSGRMNLRSSSSTRRRANFASRCPPYRAASVSSSLSCRWRRISGAQRRRRRNRSSARDRRPGRGSPAGFQDERSCQALRPSTLLVGHADTGGQFEFLDQDPVVGHGWRPPEWPLKSRELSNTQEGRSRHITAYFFARFQLFRNYRRKLSSLQQ